MITGGHLSRSIMLVASGLLLLSCMLPGMIPLKSGTTATAEPATAAEPQASAEQTGTMPTMEKDADVVIEKLKAGEFVYLEALAKEKYKEEDFAKPGTVPYTVTITDDKPTYFHYGWCTTTEEILQQNFEHIRVGLFFDGKPLGTDVVHSITFTRPDKWVCLEFGVLMSDWAPGKYKLTAVATFDEKINDGGSDFEAGEYISEYNVTVK